jgi:serine/threonine-protein kinase
VDYIGPYRLLKLIRAGNATHVWEAMNSVDNKRVAIKSLQPEHRKNKNEIATLKHEYTVGKTLDHPNVNPVSEYNVAREIPYVVMDYFNAPNLKQSIRLVPELIKEHLTDIIKQAASGLHHLHEQGWIHRDVKPDNFLISDKAQVRLIDFAIGQKIKKKSALGGLFGGKAKIMGTRSYMSPEQIRGEHLDRQADIYSFGCVAFELCVGRAPFTGNTADELLNKHLRAPIPAISSLNKEVTSDFSKLIMRAMSKKAEKRPATLKEFLKDFDKIRVFAQVKKAEG